MSIQNMKQPCFKTKKVHSIVKMENGRNYKMRNKIMFNYTTFIQNNPEGILDE